MSTVFFMKDIHQAQKLNAWSEVNNFDVPKYINSPSWPTGTDIALKIHSVLDLWTRNTPLESVLTILPSLFWQSLTLHLGALRSPSWTANLTRGFYLQTPYHCTSISLLLHYGDFLFGVSGCFGLTHGIICLGGSFYLCLMNDVCHTFLFSKLLQAFSELLHTSIPSRMKIPALQHS